MNTPRRFSRLVSSPWLRAGTAAAVLVGVGALVYPLFAALGDYDIAQEPLYSKKTQPPLMMMVMSRDEQLFNKAYSDYSDLDEDGTLDTTYQDKFDYSGYFDSNLCYTYSSSQFKATAQATGAQRHTCSGTWSGNFLNWATMSRLDVMRYVLYGGHRITDTASKTVLERAQIPNDLHAWVKVYSGADINNFTPYKTTMSFCNASISATGAPLMRVASGSWGEWASTAGYQCIVGRSDEGKDDSPRSVAADLNVRVEVCATGSGTFQEAFCRKYNDGTRDYLKPAGLLQSYGESGRLRFGLVTGTYVNPRDGGVVRRNIGRIAGNGTTFCAAGDEINLSNGQFCNTLAGGAEGIINTISNFRIDQWNWKDKWTDCDDYSILNRQGFDGRGNLTDPGNASKKCSAWGNPLAEMYAEALRYIKGETKGIYSASGDLSGLPNSVAWKDPYRSPNDGGNSYCATCNILVMSSGLPSFDSDNIGTVTGLTTAAAATDAIGNQENITGGSYMAGRVGLTNRYASINTHEDICRAVKVTGLSLVRGICPDVPSTEGSYLISGLAKAAAETDLRPGVQDKPNTYKLTATTYTVAMAESLPKFEIPVGNGKITLAPLCQANNTEGAGINSSGWRSCFLGSVGVGTKRSAVSPNYVYGRDYRADGKAGSFSLVWEDSLWGNDHDNDVVSMLSYCVGSTCSDGGTTPFRNICWRSNSGECSNNAVRNKVGEDEVLVRIENLSAYAGNAMLTGYTIVGSNAADNVQRLVLRPGNRNGSVLSTSADPPATWTGAVVMRYKLGTGQAGQLESPLWYAAKYGVPEGRKWDSKVPGVPDNYFLARNPAKLKSALESIFDSAAAGEAPVGGSGTGARVNAGSFTVSAHYTVPSGSNDWTGDVIASQTTSTGGAGAELWRASTKMSASGRTIVMSTAPTYVNTSNQLVPVAAADFTADNVPGRDRAEKLGNMGLNTVPNWFGSHSVADLVSYLRGSPVSGFRPRSSLLGDIVNSSVEIVSNKDDYGFTSWQAQGGVSWKTSLGLSYRAYLATKVANGGPPSMVYVGANDGMLHGFNASTGTSAGSEQFAFIPSASLQHMAELANPTYGHRYYVDGGLTSSDVYYGDAWRTVLVGSTGGGGASRGPSATAVGNGSVFALDISNPTGFTARNVLWEISGKTESDLGFVMGKPVVVPVAGPNADSPPRFVALFGNGVNSSTGRPVLYVVDISTGEILKRVYPTAGKYAVANGLNHVTAVALHNSSGLADTVYGGDMQGNMWRFDLRGGDPSAWNVALNGTPLFTAVRSAVAQPITGAIEVSAGPGGGVSLFFGTGRYFTADDNAVTRNSPVQTLYGLWDNLSTAISSRDSLVGQTVSANGAGFRDVSGNGVDYASKRGWYVDLIVGSDVEGERFFGYPTLQGGAVMFTTYVPGQAVCGTGGGTNWRYRLNMLTGQPAMSGLTDEVGGNALCGANCGAGALTRGGDIATGAPVLSTNVNSTTLKGCDPSDPKCTVDGSLDRCIVALNTPGADTAYGQRACGRQSWRQIR